jgi:hypothetical protein
LSNAGKGSGFVEGTSSMRSGETKGATSSAAAKCGAEIAVAVNTIANANRCRTAAAEKPERRSQCRSASLPARFPVLFTAQRAPFGSMASDNISDDVVDVALATQAAENRRGRRFITERIDQELGQIFDADSAVQVTARCRR